MNLKLRNKILLFLIFLLISIVLWLSMLLRLNGFKTRDVLKVSAQSSENVYMKTTVSSVDHYVSKSLDEILRSSPELSDHVLFFNHVPKTGGEMLVLLLQWLQGSNGFRHIRLRGGKKRKLTRREQEELVEEVTKHVRDEAVPVTFDRHVYFLNFTEFGRQSPTFINLVRDPIHKAISRFYYGRVTPNPRNPDLVLAPVYIKQRNRLLQYKTFEECVLKKDTECNFVTGLAYDLTIPYFCGHLDLCMVLNDPWALQRAKQNVDRYFPVVGILEELNSTLTVLENKLPYFFKGVKKIYYDDLLGNVFCCENINCLTFFILLFDNKVFIIIFKKKFLPLKTVSKYFLEKANKLLYVPVGKMDSVLNYTTSDILKQETNTTYSINSVVTRKF